MPATPTLTLCDQLVTALVDAWQPEAPSGAERCYFKRVGGPGSGALELRGRRVTVIPSAYDNDLETVGEDWWTHRVTVQVMERYAGTDGEQGDPPTAWTDGLVDWVYQYVVQGFDFSRGGPAWNPNLRTASAAVEVVDLDKMLNGGNLFLSQVDFVFNELRDA